MKYTCITSWWNTENIPETIHLEEFLKQMWVMCSTNIISDIYHHHLYVLMEIYAYIQ